MVEYIEEHPLRQQGHPGFNQVEEGVAVMGIPVDDDGANVRHPYVPHHVLVHVRLLCTDLVVVL